MNLLKSGVFHLLAIISTVKATSYRFTNVSFAAGSITTLSSIDDSLYFTGGNNLYSYSLATGERNTIGSIVSSTFSSSTALNSKIYITTASNRSLYEYDPVLGLSLVVPENSNNSTVGITSVNGKVYFGSDYGYLFEFDPVTRKNRTVQSGLGYLEGISALSYNKKLYAAGYNAHALNELEPITGSVQRVTSALNHIKTMIEHNNKLYIGANDISLHEYDPIAKNLSTLCIFGDPIGPWALAVFNRDIYIGGINSRYLWKYNWEAATCEKIPVPIPENGNVQALATLNNRLYIGSNNSYLYEFFEPTDIGAILEVNNLRNILNITDKVILNEINYLNPGIDTSLLKVIKKSNISATIEGSDNYSGQQEVYYTIADATLPEISDLTELIKKGIFFTHRNISNGANAKEINVTTDNLTFLNAIAFKSNESIQEPPTINRSICYKSITLSNNQNQNVLAQTPSCKYEVVQRVDSKFFHGLKDIEFVDENKVWRDLIGIWPFENVDFKVCTDTEVTHNEDTVILSKVWDSSIETNPCSVKSEIVVESETITIPPNSKVNVTATQAVRIEKVTLNIEQIIYGEVRADIVNIYGETIELKASVKKIMGNLKDQELLPSQIEINGDESITFNGKLIRTLTSDSTAKIEVTEILNEHN